MGAFVADASNRECQLELFFKNTQQTSDFYLFKMVVWYW